MARALELIPIATGVDDTEQRNSLAKLGCLQGSGDLYLKSTSEAISAVKPRSPAKSQKAR